MPSRSVCSKPCTVFPLYERRYARQPHLKQLPECNWCKKSAKLSTMHPEANTKAMVSSMMLGKHHSKGFTEFAESLQCAISQEIY